MRPSAQYPSTPSAQLTLHHTHGRRPSVSGGGGGPRLLLLGGQLEPQRLGHRGRRRPGHAQRHLHTVVDEPLQRREGTDHDDTRRQALPHAHEAQTPGDVDGRGALGHVELADDGVSGVGDDGAEHAGDVAGGERHHQLLALGAVGARLGHHVPADAERTPVRRAGHTAQNRPNDDSVAENG